MTSSVVPIRVAASLSRARHRPVHRRPAGSWTREHTPSGRPSASSSRKKETERTRSGRPPRAAGTRYSRPITGAPSARTRSITDSSASASPRSAREGRRPCRRGAGMPSWRPSAPLTQTQRRSVSQTASPTRGRLTRDSRVALPAVDAVRRMPSRPAGIRAVMPGSFRLVREVREVREWGSPWAPFRAGVPGGCGEGIAAGPVSPPQPGSGPRADPVPRWADAPHRAVGRGVAAKTRSGS